MFTHYTRASAYTRLESGVKRGWRRKGRGGEGGEKGEGILTFSFSDNFYLALQWFF